MPALLNGLGKLQMGTGDFPEARQTFGAVAVAVTEPAARAEACFNAYRAALEERRYDEALKAVRQAADLDARRFLPFPLRRYSPQRILGAGGFGTAFHCRDEHFDEEVVVKTLHAADLARGLKEVFREANTLKKLSHPAIIGVRDAEYADPEGQGRPYLVMDYFPGETLSVLLQRGPLEPADVLAIARQVALGMQAAHERGILHRDLKPENVLARRNGSVWEVKVIDFGLALRQQTIETSQPVASMAATVLGGSVAGTIKYAPPQHMGELKDANGKRVPVGPYSDVYAFGKLCCYLLFKTTEPKTRHWSTVARELAELLEGCTEHELEHRTRDFAAVLKVLEALDPASEAAHRREKEETERRRREAEEQERNKVTLLRNDGLTKLHRMLRESLDRSQGKISKEDNTTVAEHCRRYHVSAEEARSVFKEVHKRWQDDHPAIVEPVAGQVITNSIGMKLVFVPRGSFWMGGEGGTPGTRQVEIAHDFYLGAHEVTQAQWKAVMGEYKNPSHFSRKGGGKDKVKDIADAELEQFPVEQVSWEDAQEFMKRLRGDSGWLYRLPMEAEWEYACRGGLHSKEESGFDFHFGQPTNDLSSEQANFNGTYPAGTAAKGKYLERTTKVGSYQPNRLGLYDMHGNVWEWCQDAYHVGWARVCRGGSWRASAWSCRSAFRDGVGPRVPFSHLGFRPALVPSGSK